MRSIQPGERVIFVGSSSPSSGISHTVRRVSDAKLSTNCGIKRNVIEVLGQEPAREHRDGDCARC